MKTVILALASLTEAFSLRGQAPTLTTIAGHAMGETLQQWLSESPNDLAGWKAACESRARGAQGKIDKTNCTRAHEIEAGSVPSFPTGTKERSFTWTFVLGKLAEVKVDVPGPSAGSSYQPDIENEFRMLTERYGKPASTDTKAFQDAYGAQLQAREAFWVMPDGTRIAARERVSGNAGVGTYGRSLTVMFTAKDQAEEQSKRAQQQKDRNPY